MFNFWKGIIQILLGLLFILKQIFQHYVTISGPTAPIALFTGLFATVVGTIMLFVRPSRKYIVLLAIISLLPFFIGIGGSLLWTRQIEETAVLEQRIGMEPSARRYFDLEYGYNESLIGWFPVAVGAASATLPFLLVVRLWRKNRVPPKKR